MSEGTWLPLPLSELARNRGVSREALRKRIQDRARIAVDPKRVEFDGHRFRKRDERWHATVREPWHREGRLREWLPLKEAAARLRLKPGTLRGRLQRHSRLIAGVRVSGCRHLLGCKFGDTWMVSFEDDGSEADV